MNDEAFTCAYDFDASRRVGPSCHFFIVHRRSFERRRAGPLRSGTIARELHVAPNIISRFTARTEDLSQHALLEQSRRALEAE